MNLPLAMRIRIKFAKTDAMRFTGNLDLHRAWERTFRRAGLPLAYSQGFNPRPRIQLASALPLGFTSQEEIADAWLEEDLPLEAIHAALDGALPPGLNLLEITEIDLRSPALQTEIDAAEFIVTLLDPVPNLGNRLVALLHQEELIRQRRGKSYDLRPLILDMAPLPPGKSDQQRIFLRLAAREGATGRPEEVINALGIPVYNTRVERTKLIFEATVR
jgi:radical SAM-linked protein